VSENTGVTDVVMNPNRPDVLIAASYQRRRHVWTLIDGGPESALYKSTDAGATWTKLKSGLPNEEMGRIGLAMAPTNSDIIYAIIESIDKKGGIFRSEDSGATWNRRNEFDQQAQYYAHLVVDPVNPERIYVMNVYIQVSTTAARHFINSARNSSTSTIMKFGSILRTPVTIWWAVTAEFMKVLTEAPIGAFSPICR